MQLGMDADERGDVMERVLKSYCRLLEWLLVAMLASMVALVFGNVVMRYGFSSGIMISEEMSRWLFVWLTFLGAIVALKERAHLGTDMLVSRLRPVGQRLCLIASEVIMIGVTWLLGQGAWEQAVINLEVQTPVTGASMAMFYASGVVFAVSAGAILLLQLHQTITGRVRDEELIQVKESEELAQMHELDLDRPQTFEKH